MKEREKFVTYVGSSKRMRRILLQLEKQHRGGNSFGLQMIPEALEMRVRLDGRLQTQVDVPLSAALQSRWRV